MQSHVNGFFCSPFRVINGSRIFRSNKIEINEEKKIENKTKLNLNVITGTIDVIQTTVLFMKE